MLQMLLLAASGEVSPLRAQTPDSTAAAPSTLLRVFAECGACESDYLRNELTFVNLVRDRKLADVHVLVTSLQSGSGGTQFSIELTSATRSDTMLVNVRADVTSIERREVLVRAIKVGLLPFLRGNTVMDNITLVYKPPTATASTGTARGERDRWKGWVYRINAGGNIEADDNYGSQQAELGVSASRVTDAIKINLSADGDYRKTRFTFDDARVIYRHQRSWSVDGIFVKSLGPHLSTGVVGSAESSLFQNITVATEVAAAVEYDIFPYREATQRQIIFLYTLGARSVDYVDSTIFGRIAETRPRHSFTAASEIRQRWGSVNGAAEFSQYLHDLSKRRLELNGSVNWRIIAGLSLNVYSSYSVIRDQLNIPGAELTDEDRLLRQRELASGYSLDVGVGISYTFGSLFNNVVNPRMRRID